MSLILENLLKSKFFEKQIVTNWEKIKLNLKDIEKQYKSFTGSIYVISDIHIPFKNDEKIKLFLKMLEKDKNKKLIIINGDLLDMTNFKSFIDGMPVISLEKEIWLGKEFVRLLNKFSSDIIFMFANHEKRLYKRLSERFTKEQTNDIIQQIKKQLINDFLNYDCKISENWFLKIGNLGIVHPETNSSTRGKTSSDICEWFYERVPEVDIWFIAHTHKQCVVGYKGKFGIETGCLCNVMDYSINPKLMYRNERQYYGFGYSFMNKGKTDINNCRFVNLGIEGKLL